MRFSCPSCEFGAEGYLDVAAHVTQSHPDETFLCGRRHELPSVMGDSRDYWRKEPNGDRCCSYCGSLSEEGLVEIMEKFVAGEPGYKFEHTTKSYKVYANRPGVSNAGQGGIKFYMVHVDQAHADFGKRKELFGKASELAREKLRALFTANPKPWPPEVT